MVNVAPIILLKEIYLEGSGVKDKDLFFICLLLVIAL